MRRRVRHARRTALAAADELPAVLYGCRAALRPGLTPCHVLTGAQPIPATSAPGPRRPTCISSRRCIARRRLCAHTEYMVGADGVRGCPAGVPWARVDVLVLSQGSVLCWSLDWRPPAPLEAAPVYSIGWVSHAGRRRRPATLGPVHPQLEARRWREPVRAGQHDGGSARPASPLIVSRRPGRPCGETLARTRRFGRPAGRQSPASSRPGPGGPLAPRRRRRRRRAALGAPALWQARSQGSVRAPKGPR